MRRAYPSYKRRPQAQFRAIVERAIQVVQRKGGPRKPELRLQARLHPPITHAKQSSSKSGLTAATWQALEEQYRASGDAGLAEDSDESGSGGSDIDPEVGCCC